MIDEDIETGEEISVTSESKGFPIPFPFPVPAPPTTKPIKIVSPANNAKLPAGTKGNLVATMTEESFFQSFKKATFTVRDVVGNTILMIEVPFTGATATFSYVYPSAAGSYSFEVKVLGVLGFGNVVETSQFEIEAKQDFGGI